MELIEEQTNLGKMYLQQDAKENTDHFRKAQAAFENVVKIYEELGDEVHPARKAEAHLCLGYAMQGHGDFASSILAFRRGIELAEASGESHLLGEGYLNYAEVLHMEENAPEAEAAVRKAIPILEEKYGADSEYFGAASSNLAIYLCMQKGKEEEALEHSMRALRIFDKRLGRDSEMTVFAVTNALRILKELNRPKEFAQLRDEFSEIQLDVEPPKPSEDSLRKFYEEWSNRPAKKTLDPSGFVRSEEMAKEELSEFTQFWADKGFPMDFNYSETLAREFMQMDDEGPFYKERQEEFFKSAALDEHKDLFDEQTFQSLKEHFAQALDEN